MMKTITLKVELTYNEEFMYSDQEGFEWFKDCILLGNDLILHSNEIGATVGTVKVLEMTVCNHDERQRNN